MPGLTTADGRTLAWRELGSGPVLLCHPGGPGSSAAYFGELPELAARRTLVLLDPRGTGASDRPADPAAYALEQYADDIEAVREHLGIERLDLLGHSHGGFVAMVWGSAHPARVGRLVLASTVPRFTDDIRGRQRQRVGAHHGQPYFEDAMAALQAHQRGEYGDDAELGELRRRESRLFAPVGVDLGAAAAVGDALRRAGTNADALRHFNHHVAGTMDLRARLARIDAPTLVVGGADDVFSAGLGEIADALPNATLAVLPGLDHFPFLEGPEHRAQWSGVVLAFLAEG
jgi:pimeloyl-ACP methyl ester carboxylesterase